ncbi:MAG: tRNA (adenosine(37)-N6)-threonylcarbamoyltransferase complex dimerization subunit type 1 TsaB [Flavobacteriales bacterium]|nr:tRNA (adenosine(37)-N6)-threonylcarbamoyltransferase complex dimerization subunit type 1 TsaB [Flavobacteriales bacterium]
MGLVLAIETSTHLCSVAVGRDGALLAERNEEGEGFIHAERLHVLAEEVMREAGEGFAALDALAVGIGPGSYTGLRIGLSAAKGYAHALGRPIIGVGTLEVLTAALHALGAALEPGPVRHPMIDARRMEVFTAPFTADGRPLGAPEPRVLEAEWAAGLGAALVFGDGADKASALWAATAGVEHMPGIRPWARALLGVAEERLRAGAVDDLAYLVPLYGKEAGVTKPRT